MKSSTVEETTPGLGQLVDQALAGEQIQIRKGNRVVELRQVEVAKPADDKQLAPREALRRLQEDGRLMAQQAERYLDEVREGRLAAEN